MGPVGPHGDPNGVLVDTGACFWAHGGEDRRPEHGSALRLAGADRRFGSPGQGVDREARVGEEAEVVVHPCGHDSLVVPGAGDRSGSSSSRA